jgi:hypothetical protein
LSRAFFGGIGTAALTHRAVSFSFGMWVCFQKKSHYGLNLNMLNHIP